MTTSDKRRTGQAGVAFDSFWLFLRPTKHFELKFGRILVSLLKEKFK